MATRVVVPKLGVSMEPLTLKEVPTLGTFVIGTVKRDLHDMGKTMHGRHVKAVKKYKANILALSALLTMSASESGRLSRP